MLLETQRYNVKQAQRTVKNDLSIRNAGNIRNGEKVKNGEKSELASRSGAGRMSELASRLEKEECLKWREEQKQT